MEFEWDQNKNRANIAKHGIDFELAQEIFSSPTLTKIDDKDDYGEAREISYGELDNGIVLTVVHTQREEKNEVNISQKSKQKGVVSVL